MAKWPRKRMTLYNVYNDYKDLPIIYTGTVHECAKAMGISDDGFYKAYNRCKKGISCKWFIERTGEKGTEPMAFIWSDYKEGV